MHKFMTLLSIASKDRKHASWSHLIRQHANESDFRVEMAPAPSRSGDRSSELPTDRKERELVICFAETSGQDAHAVPEDFIGEVFVGEEELVERVGTER